MAFLSAWKHFSSIQRRAWTPKPSGFICRDQTLTNSGVFCIRSTHPKQFRCFTRYSTSHEKCWPKDILRFDRIWGQTTRRASLEFGAKNTAFKYSSAVFQAKIYGTADIMRQWLVSWVHVTGPWVFGQHFLDKVTSFCLRSLSSRPPSPLLPLFL